MGVTCLLDAMGIRPVVLDSVEADDMGQLALWIKRTRECKPMASPHALVLDDLDGFTEQARTKVTQLATESVSGHAPTILICDNLRAPMWKSLASLPAFRMRTPTEHVTYEWFVRHHQWSIAHDAVPTVGVPPAYLRAMTELLQLGDLRRIAIAVTLTAAVPSSPLATRGDVTVSNVFEATRKLFKRSFTPQQWTQHAEARDVELLQFHATNYTGTDIHTLADTLDSFSRLDASRPSRYEHMVHYDATNRYVSAATVPYPPLEMSEHFLRLLARTVYAAPGVQKPQPML